MKIKSVIGWDGNYLMFEVDNANSGFCKGDLFWCGDSLDSTTGELLIVSETVTREDVMVWAKECSLSSSQCKVLLGMLVKSGVIQS